MKKIKLLTSLVVLGLLASNATASEINITRTTAVGTRPGVGYEKAINQVLKAIGANRRDMVLTHYPTGFVQRIMGSNYPDKAVIKNNELEVKLEFIPIKPFKTSQDVVLQSIVISSINGHLDPGDYLVKKLGKPTVSRDKDTYSYDLSWCNYPDLENQRCVDGITISASYDSIIFQDMDLGRQAVVEAGKI